MCGPYNAQPSGPGLAADLPGVEVLRAWFFQRTATYNGQPDWVAFDNTLNAARARGDKVVVTLTDHWGACEDGVTGAKTESWYTSGYKTQPMPRTSYRAFVQEVVTRYRNDPAVLMWQMVNEAESKNSSGGCSPASVLRNFADDIGGLIRSIDPNHLISLGTMGGGQCGSQGTDYRTIHSSPFIDICEIHDYSGDDPMPSVFTGRIADCNALGKPMFVGETGREGRNYSSLQARADVFARKIDAAWAQGVDGYLLWNLEDSRVPGGGCNPQSYGICWNDPALGVLAGR